MTQPYVKIENVSKRFGKDEILKDLSLEIQRGDFLVIFGPSGGGKTTLLKLIAGALRPDSGKILLDGRSVSNLEPEFRNVAMAFQTFALYPHLSAYDNIASPLRAHGVEPQEIDRRVHDITRMLKIEHVLGQMPGTLSNGQKQRTALCRALIREPAIVLLDDPLRNVDAKLRYEMRLELPHILRRFQATMIYVTQDFKEAMALGDHVGVLLDGKIRQIDTPRTIYRRPVDLEVAELFGDPPINAITVQPRKGDGDAITVRVGGEDFPAPTCPPALVGRDCVMGVRPEDITILSAPSEGAARMRLDAVLPLNVRTALSIKGDDQTQLMASTWDITAELIQSEGREIWVRPQLSHAIFFDSGSGARIEHVR